MTSFLPPRAMTGNEVNTRLYNRMNVYWYKYVASKLLKIMNQNMAKVQMTFCGIPVSIRGDEGSLQISHLVEEVRMHVRHSLV